MYSRSRVWLTRRCFDINEAVLRSLSKQLCDLAQETGPQCTCEISTLLTLPGIVQPALPNEETEDLIASSVLSITEQALANFQTMRSEEGSFLLVDLNSHCDVIREELTMISERRDQVIHTYADRIRKRVNELLSEAKLKLG